MGAIVLRMAILENGQLIFGAREWRLEVAVKSETVFGRRALSSRERKQRRVQVSSMCPSSRAFSCPHPRPAPLLLPFIGFVL